MKRTQRLVQLLLGFATLFASGRAQDCDPADQIWDTLQPGTVDSLTWAPCFNATLCAKLQVPVDYNKPNGTQAVIALLKVPAAVPMNDTSYKGPILFNPGGPGGSGVDAIRSSGKAYQALFGSEYDIVGFDPRGVGHTIPAASVFSSLPESFIWQLQDTDGPLPFESADAIARLYDNSHVYGDLVAKGGQSYAPFVSTALVARDMLEITRAHGREKLLYWGVSYGSLLGMTYAAMLPNNIERLIVDGVIDADDYLSGTQASSLVRTDAGLHAVYQACVDAGPSECAIHEASVDKISARVDAIFNNLKRRPIPVFVNESSDTGTYGLMTYKLVHSLFFSFLYSPYLGPPNATLATVALRALEQGDPSLFWAFAGASQGSLTCNGTTFPLPPIFASSEAERTILCVDTDPVDGTIDELEAYFDGQAKISQFADTWPIASQCKGWQVRPIERFRGPFVANTSFPLLFVGNVNDTVLPVQNAIKMSKGFAGSVVLTQNSSGHTSLAANSVCVATALRDYMRDGKLPAPGTVCEIESKFFGGPVSGNATSGNSTMAKRETEIAEAWDTLVSSVRVPRFGLL